MKKMMMTAVAVVMTAGMASAASLQWSVSSQFVSGAGCLPGGETWGGAAFPNATPVKFALVLSSDVTAALALILPAAADGSFIPTIGMNADPVFLGWGSNTGNRGAMSTQVATSSKITTSEASYVAIAFVQYDGGWYFKYSGGVPGKGYISEPDQGTEPTFSNSFWNAGMAGWTLIPIIPEPTAMALLALGVAAVGLRRRFSK